LRLKHDARARDPDGAQLLGDDEAVLGVGDDQRRGEAGRVAGAAGGLLEHSLGPGERQKLLGVGLAREGPEPGAGAAGEQNRDDGRHGA
jgi:hypothetical protein